MLYVIRPHLLNIQECQNPCCNATTCTLIAGATCDTGLCCEDCQLKSYGSTCREAVGECDVLEYCSGEDSDCPIDLGVQNGLSCNNNQSYCFYGSCQTYDAQCRYHWGEGGDKWIDTCVHYSLPEVPGVTSQLCSL